LLFKDLVALKECPHHPLCYK